MGTQSDFRVKKNLIVGDGTISSDSGNLVLRRDFDDTTYNQITLGDDTYKITLDNSDRFYIDGDGKAGIGTTSPDRHLHVNAGNENLGGIEIEGSGVNTSLSINNTGTDGGEYRISVSRDGHGDGSNKLLFQDGNVTKIALDSSGNVGIGTTSPVPMFHVKADNGTTDMNSAGAAGITIEQDGAGDAAFSMLLSGTRRWMMGIDNSDSDKLKFATGGTSVDSGTALTIDTSGNVGIGTTSPSGNLHISATQPRLYLSDSDEGTGTGDSLLITKSGTISYIYDRDASSKLYLGAADDSDIVVIDGANARVGIGTTAPVAPLEIKSVHGVSNNAGYKSHLLIVDQSAFDAANNGGAILFGGKEDSGGNLAYWAKISGEKANTSADDLSGTLHFWTRKTGSDPAQRMMIDEDGYVGIGTTAPTHMLHLSDDSRVDIKFTRASHEDHYIRKDGHYLRIRGHDDSTVLMEIRNNSSSNHISFPNSNIGIGVTTPGYALDIQRPDAKINLKDTTDNDDMLVRFEGNDGNEYGVVGYEGSTVFKIESPQGRVINIGGHANVKVGVTTADMTFTPSALFHVNGALKATTKSFDIEHPTKEGMRLHHGVLEGPEHGVYIRGHQVGETIELPDYWLGLVDEDTITVQLTAKGRTQNLYVKSVDREKVVVGGFITKPPDFYYFIQAERKDVDKMEVEYGSVH